MSRTATACGAKMCPPTMPALRCMLLCRVLMHLLRRGAITESVARSTRVTKVVARRASRVLSVSAGLAMTLTNRSTCSKIKAAKKQNNQLDA